MNVMVPLPDKLAARFGDGADRDRRVLEILAVSEYAAGRMMKGELGEVLGFSTPDEVDAFLQRRAATAAAAPSLSDSTGPRRNKDPLDLLALSRAARAGQILGGLDVVALIREGHR